MKKLLKVGKFLSITALCMGLLVGCGSASDKKTTASLSVKNESVEQTINIELTHDDENVSSQKQEAVMKFKDKATYQNFLTKVKAQGYDAVAKEYKGINYEMTTDDASFTIKENIVLNFSELPAAGYKKITGGAVNVTDPYRIDLEITLKSFKDQGYTVTEDK